LAVYLQEYTCPNCEAGAGQHIPFERTQEFFQDVCHLPLSEGTLAEARETCAAQLEPVENAIKQALSGAPVLNCDETGQRVAGHTNWLHVASTATLTFLARHAKRGRVAMTEIGLLPTYTGTAVHDGLGAYFRYGCQHALCNVHLLRDLTAVSESTRQRWPQRLADLLLKIKASVARALAAGHKQLTRRQLKTFTGQYQHLFQTGLRSNPPPGRTGRRGRPSQGPTPAHTARCWVRSLLLRLKKHQAAVLAFMHDFRVPPQGQQPGRARPAHGQGPSENRRRFSQSARGRHFLPHPRLHFHHAQAGSEPLGRAPQRFAGQILMPRLTAE